MKSDVLSLLRTSCFREGSPVGVPVAPLSARVRADEGAQEPPRDLSPPPERHSSKGCGRQDAVPSLDMLHYLGRICCPWEIHSSHKNFHRIC